MKDDGAPYAQVGRKRGVNGGVSTLSTVKNTSASNEEWGQGWLRSDRLFVLRQCLLGRLYIFCVQICARLLIPDCYTDAFLGVGTDKNTASSFDSVIIWLFSGYARWDSVHFLHIAEYGYTYENSLAFFPLFPLLVYFMGMFCICVVPIMSFSTALLLGAVLTNLIAFVVAGQLLYVLLFRLSKCRKTALIGCIIFSFNPASIFFSAAYTESLFFCLTLAGLTVLYADEAPSFFRYCVGACCFSLSFLTRSNGFLNFGYIGYHLMLDLFYHPSINGWNLNRTLGKYVRKTLRAICTCVLSFIIVVGLVVVHGIVQTNAFCTLSSRFSDVPEAVLSAAEQNHLVLPGEVNRIEWCRSERSLLSPLPVFYGPVQRKYWDVGFLQYWQVKKIPCFILPLPALVLVILGVKQFIRKYVSSVGSLATAVKVILNDRYSALPFMIHAVFISVCGLLFYNVEIVTRMLFSSSPFMYLVIAELMKPNTSRLNVERDIKSPGLFPFLSKFHGNGFTASHICSLYLMTYAVVGSAMHSVWLPFV